MEAGAVLALRCSLHQPPRCQERRLVVDHHGAVQQPDAKVALLVVGRLGRMPEIRDKVVWGHVLVGHGRMGDWPGAREG